MNESYENDKFLTDCLELNKKDDIELLKDVGVWMNNVREDIPLNIDDELLKYWICDLDNQFWYHPNCFIKTSYSIIYKAWMPDHGLCVYKYITELNSASVNEHVYLEKFLPFTIPHLVKTDQGLVYPFRGFDVDIHYRNICKEQITKQDFESYSICASMIVHHKYILDTIRFIAGFVDKLYNRGVLWKDAKLSNVLYQQPDEYKVIDVGSLKMFDEFNDVAEYYHNTFTCVNGIFLRHEYFNTYIIGLVLLEMICTRIDVDFLIDNLDQTVEIIKKHRSHNSTCNTLVTWLFLCFGDDLQLLKDDTTTITPISWPLLFHHLT